MSRKKSVSLFGAIFKPGTILNRLEEAIVRLLFHVQYEMHQGPISATDIREQLEKNLEKRISSAMLYFTLDKLVERNVIRVTPKEGGRTKRLFSLNEKVATNELEKVDDLNRTLKEKIRFPKSPSSGKSNTEEEVPA